MLRMLEILSASLASLARTEEFRHFYRMVDVRGGFGSLAPLVAGLLAAKWGARKRALML
jgi:hypothetical protein